MNIRDEFRKFGSAALDVAMTQPAFFLYGIAFGIFMQLRGPVIEYVVTITALVAFHLACFCSGVYEGRISALRRRVELLEKEPILPGSSESEKASGLRDAIDEHIAGNPNNVIPFPGRPKP